MIRKTIFAVAAVAVLAATALVPTEASAKNWKGGNCRPLGRRHGHRSRRHGGVRELLPVGSAARRHHGQAERLRLIPQPT